MKIILNVLFVLPLVLSGVALADENAPGSRPGDESLTCPQIEAEVRSMMAATQPYMETDIIQGHDEKMAQMEKDKADAVKKTAAGTAATAAEAAKESAIDSITFGLGSKLFGRKKRKANTDVGNMDDLMKAAEQQQAEAQQLAAMMQSAPPPGMDRMERLDDLARAKGCEMMSAPPPDLTYPGNKKEDKPSN